MITTGTGLLKFCSSMLDIQSGILVRGVASCLFIKKNSIRCVVQLFKSKHATTIVSSKKCNLYICHSCLQEHYLVMVFIVLNIGIIMFLYGWIEVKTSRILKFYKVLASFMFQLKWQMQTNIPVPQNIWQVPNYKAL